MLALLGPQPSPELLLRWVQLGIYSSRFAINCFKTSPGNNSVGEVIEPWMFPEITPLIRNAIKRRYEILPYLYSLSLESHLTASPPQRWVGWGYESDPEVWSKRLKLGEDQFWFGDTILVGGVYEPGVTIANMYLPREGNNGFDYGYVNMNAPYNYLASGQWVEIASQWRTSIPLLAKVGGAIPVGKSVATRVPGETDAPSAVLEEDDYRGVEIFPPRGSSHGKVFSFTWLEDDGMSLQPRISCFTLRYSSTDEGITVGFMRTSGAADDGSNLNSFIPAWKDLHIILHCGDERHAVSDAGKPLEYAGKDARGRHVYRLRNGFG
jgi:alpha-glucosidase (family GH31 glycosyl hydrolase)